FSEVTAHLWIRSIMPRRQAPPERLFSTRTSVKVRTAGTHYSSWTQPALLYRRFSLVIALDWLCDPGFQPMRMPESPYPRPRNSPPQPTFQRPSVRWDLRPSAP